MVLIVVDSVGVAACVYREEFAGRRWDFAMCQDAQRRQQTGVMHSRERPGAGDASRQVCDHQVVQEADRAEVGLVADQPDPDVDVEDGDQQQAGHHAERPPVAAAAARLGDTGSGGGEGEGEPARESPRPGSRIAPDWPRLDSLVRLDG
jgi:hypothetical protein